MALEPLNWNPRKKNRGMVEQINRVLADGEDRTVRDIYYALTARGITPHNEPEIRYRNDVQQVVSKGRRSGKIDPTQIIDSSRLPATVVDSGFESPDDFAEYIESQPEQYDENFWRDQDHYVEVWIEKASLISVFEPVCKYYNIRLEAFGGQWSDSKIVEANDRLVSQLEDGKDVRVLYFGDFNYSGFQIPVSALETFGRYGLPIREDMDTTDARKFDAEYNLPVDFANAPGTFGLERLALNLDQVRRFDLPYNPDPKSPKDKAEKTLRDRFKQEVTGGEPIDVELNALKEYERDYLEALLIDGISEYVDLREKAETERRVAERRETLRKGTTVDLHPDKPDNVTVIEAERPDPPIEKTVKVRRRKRD
jgi:hypothetical protein